MLRATQASVEEAKRRAGDPFFPESDEKESVTGLHAFRIVASVLTV